MNSDSSLNSGGHAKAIDKGIIESQKYKNVFWCPAGVQLDTQYLTTKDGWHFWDEAGYVCGYETYATEDEANTALSRYEP